METASGKPEFTLSYICDYAKLRELVHIVSKAPPHYYIIIIILLCLELFRDNYPCHVTSLCRIIDTLTSKLK